MKLEIGRGSEGREVCFIAQSAAFFVQCVVILCHSEMCRPALSFLLSLSCAVYSGRSDTLRLLSTFKFFLRKLEGPKTIFEYMGLH